MRKFIQLSTILPEVKDEEKKIEINYFSFTPEKLREIQVRMLISCSGQYSFAHHIKADYTYTRLILNNETWMSDTPLETFTNQEFINKANGSVLLFGLGIGYCVFPLITDPLIKKLTIIDINKDLIDIMKPFLLHEKVDIIHGDAFTIDLGKEKFDTIYFDIWRDLSSDNYQEMKVLHKRFRKNYNIKSPDRFIASWAKDICVSEYQKDKRNGWL